MSVNRSTLGSATYTTGSSRQWGVRNASNSPKRFWWLPGYGKPAPRWRYACSFNRWRKRDHATTTAIAAATSTMTIQRYVPCRWDTQSDAK